MKVKELWSFKHYEPILGIKLGDINDDGQVEVVAYTETGTLLILSLKGELLNQEIISKNSPIWHLEIYDIDKDGTNELILGGMDGYLRTFRCNKTYFLNSLWNHKLGSSISGILIDDLNLDNKNEVIVFSLDKTIRVLKNLEGNLVWGQIFEDGIGDAIVYTDHRNPGKKEIIACGNDGSFRVFDATTGKLLWFEKYSDKIRCITYLNSINGPVIICGGDDKKLHIVDKEAQEEIKTIEFDDYIWKCISYPFLKHNKVIINSYSFAHFNSSIPLENIKFTSRLICLNETFEVIWELKGFNIEFLDVIEIYEKVFLLAGTTRGEVLVIEERTGKILNKINNDSCTNMIQFFIEKGLIFSCHENGRIFAYKVENM